ncbi:MAG: hypothetical protein L3K08_05445 [Thermoplasmata archaeon]|nr:hypothetical protein [Thermoplasmata archaeon]
MAWALWEMRRLQRIRIDMLGPRDAFDGVAFHRTRRWVATLRHPWDGVVMAGVALGLYSAVIGSATVGSTSGTNLPVAVACAGITLFAAGVSAHLSNFER